MTKYFGTGHRPTKLLGYGGLPHHNLTEFAEKVLDSVAIKEGDTVISGCALGWDLALLHAAQHTYCHTVAVIPFTGQPDRLAA